LNLIQRGLLFKYRNNADTRKVKLFLIITFAKISYMKNIICLSLVIFCTLFKAQSPEEIDSLNMYKKEYIFNEKIYQSYTKYKKQFDSLNLENNKILRKELMRIEFKEAYNKLLNLEKLGSLNIQNALLKSYQTKYNQQPLTIPFTRKEDILYLMHQYEEAFLSVITLLYLDDIQKYYEMYDNAYERYLNENLKKLNLTRKEFDDLSDDDKYLIFKEFKNIKK